MLSKKLPTFTESIAKLLWSSRDRLPPRTSVPVSRRHTRAADRNHERHRDLTDDARLLEIADCLPNDAEKKNKASENRVVTGKVAKQEVDVAEAAAM